MSEQRNVDADMPPINGRWADLVRWTEGARLPGGLTVDDVVARWRAAVSPGADVPPNHGATGGTDEMPDIPPNNG